MSQRKPYHSDASDEGRAFAVPKLTVMTDQAPQRKYDLSSMLNALRSMARAGAPSRLLSNDVPPGPAVKQLRQRWLQAQCCEAMVNVTQVDTAVAQGKQGQPSVAVVDGPTLQSTCESGSRAGYDGYKHKKGSSSRWAVDTLDHLLALRETPANEH
jgi:transposase